MNSLLRLSWALPLVLMVGAGVTVLLRRFVLPASPTRCPHRLVFREQLALSEQTRVHLVEIDGKGYLVVESSQNAALQPISTPAREASRVPGRSRPAWLRNTWGANG